MPGRKEIDEFEVPGGGFQIPAMPVAPAPAPAPAPEPEPELKRYAGVEPGVIPESKRFGGGGDRIAALQGLHVAGIAIEQWAEGKSDFELSRMSFAFTDEGLEQQRKAAAVRAMRTHGTGRDVTDESEKWLVERGDQRLDPTFDPTMAADRRKDLADEHVPVGFVPRFLSKKALSTGRDPRGFVVVKDKTTGEPVTDGESVLGMITEERAGKRRRLYQAQHNALMKHVNKTTGENAQRRRSRTGAAIMERGETIVPPLPDARIGDSL